MLDFAINNTEAEIGTVFVIPKPLVAKLINLAIEFYEFLNSEEASVALKLEMTIENINLIGYYCAYIS